MEPKVDPVRSDMRVERTRREDGRRLLLYTWPERGEAGPSPRADEPPMDPWSPESGPPDV